MKMSAEKRALDKIYKRRDRYEIPDWQRGKVWSQKKKQRLIDSILQGWRLPKFYLVKTGDTFEVVDGQQRLNAIFEFFAGDLALPSSSAAQYGGATYKELSPSYSDSFDDFEIDYDEISEADDIELKEFFQRLQEGLPLTSSERLNSVHSKLRDFCLSQSKHPFFHKSVAAANTRLAHFDIVSKVAILEIEGLASGTRYEDIQPVFVSNNNFSAASAVAKRMKAALYLLAESFPVTNPILKSRTVVQSFITLACRLVDTGKAKGLASDFASFAGGFMSELRKQIELGQAATDADYIRFQRSINANVKSGAKTRHEILLRKAFLKSPNLAASFNAADIKASGVSARINELENLIALSIKNHNANYSAIHGEDLFKATNKTVGALKSIGKPITDINDYKNFIGHLYFLFRESIGKRLEGSLPTSFNDVNLLRTDVEHDIDHGEPSKVKKKAKKIGDTFIKYSGVATPGVLQPEQFVLVQTNLLEALNLDLTNLAIPADAAHD